MPMRMSVRYIFSVLTLICLGLLYASYLDRIVALSPSFPREEIRDRPFDWRDIDRQEGKFEGSPFTDIRRVNYFSDGKYLNATLWLRGVLSSVDNEEQISYGPFYRWRFSNGNWVARRRLSNRNLEAKWNMDEHGCRILLTW